jgi:hypothetical protein
VPGPITLADLLIFSDEDEPEDTDMHAPVSPTSIALASVTTEPNDFGVYREYPTGIPSFTPDEFSGMDSLCISPTFTQSESSPSSTIRTNPRLNFFAPYPNVSTFRLMHWYQSISSTKSLGELNRLVNDVLLAPNFNPHHLENFSAVREADRIDSHHDDVSSIFSTEDGWIETSVSIPVPIEKRHNMPRMTEATAPRFEAHGLFYRKITEVVKAALKESDALQYHLAPFREFWQASPDDPVERLYSEIYTSDVLIEAHESIQHSMSNCELEKVVIPLMLWSDSTQLASFGTASLWPVYLFFGNLSKYVRAKPSSFSAHHIAYIPKVRNISQADCQG